MHPFYFGANEKQLFGIYNPPTGGREVGAIVLCNPILHEYMRIHKSLRQLAKRLCGRGWHVLRFDYFGTGDSAGADSAGTVAQWRIDVDAALNELCDMANGVEVSLVGIRLGANLALEAARRHGNVANLVLWDPIVQGTSYLDAVDRFNQRTLDYYRRTLGMDTLDSQAPVLGFPISSRLRDEIRPMTIEASGGKIARRLTLFTTEGRGPDPDLRERLRGSCGTLAANHLSLDGLWREETDIASKLGGEITKRVAEALE